MELNDSPVQKSAVEIVIQKEKKSLRPVGPQVIIVCAYLLVGMSVGMSLGHTSGLLPQLNSVNSSVYVDEDTGSWIASLNVAAGPFGSILAGITMDQWGRRKITIVANSMLFVGWLLVSVAYNVPALMVAKTIEGFARSMAATTLTILIDELADPNFRGFILCFIMTCVSGGVVVISTLTAFLDWRTVSGVATAVSLLSLFPFFVIPESPSWLVRNGRMDEATQGLIWLWGPRRETEVQEDLEFLKTRHSSKVQGCRTVQDFQKTCRAFFTPRILKPFFILHVFGTIQVFCGSSILLYYTVDILSKIKEAGGGQIIDENRSAVVVFFVRIVGNIVTTLLIIRIGRRPIALTSGIGSSVSALALGVLLITLSTKGTSPGSGEIESWLVFVLTMLFVLSISTGYLMLPVLMLGETQAAHVRGFVCGYIYTVNDLILGGTLKFYHSLLSILQIHGLFLLFGISCLLCTLFVYAFLPETQGKTLEQIEDYFRQPNVMWITRKKTSRCETRTVNGSQKLETNVLGP
ncbi:facilitated trehalose transporter Tret1-2 homolog [Zootermopsis nevadensis]|uniref:Solute carrier family 2, facilitated glucose transporter member 8 n=1 Tax=Zootermopsis nevadensis TaxID=136037 RepID=A0A067RV46_ZOONE|nr:facilitated trehalose transporter Tret1-2 homolog [Zootermopsis nevadensis]KDR23749.1 Solute carrier family 2, facilitated glucose transporter member 8 [Zootermopsis nevadensis]